MEAKLDPFAPEVVAADYVLAAIGRENSDLFVHALRAGWMLRVERDVLAPLADAVEKMAR